MTASIALQAVLLSQSAPVELWELDLQPLGGGVYRFCNQTNEKGQAVVWQTLPYAAIPVQASGFERRSTGPFPRPTLQVSNVLGLPAQLMRDWDKLRGARFIRRRTMARFLDAVNFTAGNATADSLAEWTPEVWMADRCVARNKLQVTWELRNPLDFDGLMLPGRVVHPNFCPWQYRSSDCGYTGGPVAKIDDSATSNPAEDQCSKRYSGCRKRFPNQPLPFGGFPGVGRLRQA